MLQRAATIFEELLCFFFLKQENRISFVLTTAVETWRSFISIDLARVQWQCLELLIGLRGPSLDDHQVSLLPVSNQSEYVFLQSRRKKSDVWSRACG